MKARHAGIRPNMVIGDLVRTATMIAAELGITDNDSAVIGVKLENASDEALALMVREVSVYARVNPAHKLRIVKALQREGHTVAMTGDKVNDAPALKKRPTSVSRRHRDGRLERGGARRAPRRKYRDHRVSGGGRPFVILQYPRVSPLRAFVEHRRGEDEVLRGFSSPG